MAIYTMDAEMLKNAFLAGARNLERNKAWINELNVFPVPDGDTGTNMTMTIMSAAKEVSDLQDVNLASLSKAISSGSLRGARGNSGVILSQLFRGFTKELKGLDEITPAVAAKAFNRARETAYKAVMKPKEGTILTVARGMAEYAVEIADESEDLEEMLVRIIERGDEVLAQTPEMLPVLKQAGVVDSGGQGLMVVMKGALEGMRGNLLLDEEEEEAEAEPVYGYCIEFVLHTENSFTAEAASFREFVDSLGDGAVTIRNANTIAVHAHLDDPGLLISRALTYGQLTGISVQNMAEEVQEENKKSDAARIAEEKKAAAAAPAVEEAAPSAPAEPRKEVGFISVSVGDGLAEILKGLNVDIVIEGGQTMNPSTEDILKAVDKVNADVIYVFPNNKNIILAAEQAVDLVEGKRLVVVPSASLPQGIAALISFSPAADVNENLEQMKEAMEIVRTGQVTYAVRNTMIDNKEIHEGDIMGLGDHSALLAVGKDIREVAAAMVDAMVDEESGLISVYYGADTKAEDAAAFGDLLSQKYPDCDVEVNYGGQPIYYYIVSVE